MNGHDAVGVKAKTLVNLDKFPDRRLGSCGQNIAINQLVIECVGHQVHPVFVDIGPKVDI